MVATEISRISFLFLLLLSESRSDKSVYFRVFKTTYRPIESHRSLVNLQRVELAQWSRWIKQKHKPVRVASSCPLVLDDDSTEEGGRLTVPQDTQADADTQQETLGTYAP